MKNGLLLLLIAGCCAGLLSSCLKSDETEGTEPAPNCLIVSFTLKSDSVEGLENVKFSIDQRDGRIFNIDSMPFGTEIGKVVCTVNYMSAYTVAGTQVRQEAAADTLAWWNGSDSLDFSKPVYFKVHAYDGRTTKEYKAQVNIHRVVPDSMVWALYSETPAGVWKDQQVMLRRTIRETADGGMDYYMYMEPADAAGGYALYRSSAADAKNWEALSLTGWPAGDIRLGQITEYGGAWYVPALSGGLYRSADGQEWTVVENASSVKYLLGSVADGGRNPGVLCGVTEENGELRFAAMDASGEWTAGEPVPAGFPLTGFGSGQYEAMYYRYLMAVAGRDKDGGLLNDAWGTMDGRHWVVLSDERKLPFDAREGAMLTPYDGKFFLIGGIDAAGKGLKDMYTSTDFGVTWAAADSLVILPEGYTGRGFASVAVDADQYLFLFGGKTHTNANESNQIWRGRINRLGFGR